MAILVHRYDAPGPLRRRHRRPAGGAAFFLQAREGNRITSVACEKQQVSVLAEHLDRVLDEVLRRSAGEVDVPPASTTAQRRRPAGRADHRGVPGRHDDHRLGSEHRPDRHRAVLQRETRRGGAGRGARPRPAEVERPTRSTPTRCSWSRSLPSYARDFVARAQALVAAGRPPCPFCLQPLDPERPHLPAGQRLPPPALFRLNLPRPAELCADRRLRPIPPSPPQLADGELQLDRTAAARVERHLPGRARTTERGRSSASTSRSRGERPLWDFPHRHPRAAGGGRVRGVRGSGASTAYR